MKKKLVLIAMLLFAICFAGFAQEAFSAEPSQYVAKAEEKKEFTFIVAGQVKIEGKWVLKRERITVTAEFQSRAEEKARNEFSRMYTGYGWSSAVHEKLLKKPSVSLVSTCDNYNYNF
jgi:hypothetical protein